MAIVKIDGVQKYFQRNGLIDLKKQWMIKDYDISEIEMIISSIDHINMHELPDIDHNVR